MGYHVPEKVARSCWTLAIGPLGLAAWSSRSSCSASTTRSSPETSLRTGLVEKARNRLSTTRLSQIVLCNTAALCPETEANGLPGGLFKRPGIESENAPVLPTRWTDRKTRARLHMTEALPTSRSEALLGAGEKVRTAAGIQAGGAEEGPVWASRRPWMRLFQLLLYESGRILHGGFRPLGQYAFHCCMSIMLCAKVQCAIREKESRRF